MHLGAGGNNETATFRRRLLALFTEQAYSAHEQPPRAVVAEAVEAYRGGDFIAITEQRAREFLGSLPGQIVR